MYYVYFINSIDYPDQIYIGYTADIKKRFATHNSGGCPHTAKYKPWKLVAYLGFPDKEVVLRFEKYLKSHAGKAFAKKRLW
jgi:predicted GIY-YIG superfamily endonuclease